MRRRHIKVFHGGIDASCRDFTEPTVAKLFSTPRPGENAVLERSRKASGARPTSLRFRRKKNRLRPNPSTRRRMPKPKRTSAKR